MGLNIYIFSKECLDHLLALVLVNVTYFSSIHKKNSGPCLSIQDYCTGRSVVTMNFKCACRVLLPP